MSNEFLLFGIGRNSHGQLGIENVEHIVELTNIFDNKLIGQEIVSVIQCSFYAFCIITSSSDIYMFGYNRDGQFGLNNQNNQYLPILQSYLKKQNIKIINVSQGINACHIFFISQDNKIFCSGANRYGQLGLTNIENEERYLIPQIHSYLNNIISDIYKDIQLLINGYIRINISNISNISPDLIVLCFNFYAKYIIKQIVCSEDHSLFLFVNGSVYSCGANFNGQLGYNTNDEYISRPTKIEGLNDKHITSIACGEIMSFCLDIEGNIWSFGDNTYGMLGIGVDNELEDDDEYDYPSYIYEIKWFKDNNIKIIKISCGYYHTLALDENGNIFSWGYNRDGQIGNDNYEDQFVPLQINAFNNNKIIHISCGRQHSCCLTENNKLFSWGCNTYNQCCIIHDHHDNNNTISKPKQYYTTRNISKVICGNDCTLLLINSINT